MVGLIAPGSREENKKNKKALPLLVMTRNEAPLPNWTQKHIKKEKKRGAEVPPPPLLLAMAGSKVSVQNYAHKHKEKKKRGAEAPSSIGNGGPNDAQKH